MPRPENWTPPQDRVLKGRLLSDPTIHRGETLDRPYVSLKVGEIDDTHWTPLREYPIIAEWEVKQSGKRAIDVATKLRKGHAVFIFGHAQPWYSSKPGEQQGEPIVRQMFAEYIGPELREVKQMDRPRAEQQDKGQQHGLSQS